jgi:hypothetical protein
MLSTRPNLAFAVLVISYFILNLTTTYLKAIKRIFRYLRSIIKIGLVFRELIEPLIGYINLD